jgi:hypothetical protein
VRTNPATKLLVPGLLLLLGAGCSANPGDPGGSERGGSPPGESATDPANSGSVGLSLVLPGNAQIVTVDWVVAGPNNAATVVASGNVDVHASAAASFIVPSIPAGSGYRIALSAESTDGGISCEGSAPFAVQARTSTMVAVQMACVAAGTGGHTTLVNGTGFDCAAWTSVTASPIETAVGTPLSLSASASGPMPANLTYQWSAPSGTFGAATTASTSFTCTAPGPVMVTLVVGDGPVPAGSTCNPSLETDVITVTCTGTQSVPAAPALPAWALLLLALGVAGAGMRRARVATS